MLIENNEITDLLCNMAKNLRDIVKNILSQINLKSLKLNLLCLKKSKYFDTFKGISRLTMNLTNIGY